MTPLAQRALTHMWAAVPRYLAVAASCATTVWFFRHAHYVLALVALAPLSLVRLSRVNLGRVADAQQRTRDADDLHLATIEALALAIDAKENRTQTHLHRLSILAAGLGRACGMAETEIQGLKTAAVLHDIGQLAVPEHILRSLGR